ncbi:M20/M25/M40 family metallo-hydrolase [Pseudoalteromonas tunicata]|uniref:M20/M25/M40 family metallo-hydrolase n=1 Tax=Pseudoalteromonas tunicata TaxID=314281 RepID=UPI00273F3687|nr:M20/M25/M40 family metallo-hydrolase [Pseudoalteromonas tunicata]MDP5214825.1 M20/M25/M40 family metallo-hydrolase [Pseudoalteromonas tunicata]
MLKKSCISISLLLMTQVCYAENDVWITIGKDAVPVVNKQLPHLFKDYQPSELLSFSSLQDSRIMNINEQNLAELSAVMHSEFNRCAGFIAHDSYQAAVAYNQMVSEVTPQNFNGYSIDNAQTVNALVASLNQTDLTATVTQLSNYNNRYYTQQTGQDAANWLKNHWQSVASSRSDISIELFNHTWSQPSVIATITGTSAAQDIVVIGGHLDSINQSNPTAGRAPGADDNASGIAVVTATLKAIVQSGYKPSRTIKLIGYAAEEVGLRGSKAIAQSFKDSGKNVIGVAQFDMTGNHGSANDIVFMTDYTNSAQNQFMSQLLDTYFPTINYGFDQCGYGCSDHASWHNLGYPASMPFESSMADINNRIHTSSDSVFDASHGIKFAKLAVAYAAEMAKTGEIVEPPEPDNELTNSIPKTGLTALAKQQLFFTLTFPIGASNLSFTTQGGSGDADLYVKFGQKPTLNNFDCKSTTATSNETCTINAVQAGVYHVMVEAWNDISGVTLLGKYSESIPGNDPINRVEPNLSVGRGNWLHFSQVLAPQYSELTVTISGGTGDVDLYVNAGTQPSSNQYQCRPFKNGNNEVCTFTRPATGTWFMSLYGYSAANGVTLTIDAKP